MDGEEAAGDVVRIQEEPFAFQIDQLPEPALHHLFKLLNWKDQKSMRLLCKGMQHYIDYVRGIHTYFPARNRKMLIEACVGLEGKVIRSLEIVMMHPDVDPDPFDRFIQHPWKLLRISLCYVDVGFLVTLLSGCRNLCELHYETGFYLPRRELPSSVRIPKESEQLIEFVTKLPQITFQVDKLTSLNLYLIYAQPCSDWATVPFLLLSLSQRTLDSLKNFKFRLHSNFYMMFRDRLQIFACLGQFLSRCPNLRKLEYLLGKIQRSEKTDREDTQFDYRRPSPLRVAPPQSVLSCIMQKYGSALLKEVQGAEALSSKERMLIPIRLIMKEAGTALRSLQDVSLKMHYEFEPELFQILFSAIPSPSVRKLQICDQTLLSFTGPTYNLLLAQTQSIPPLYWNLEKLCVSRKVDPHDLLADEDDANGAISLSRLLNRMRSLTRFEFVPRGPEHETSSACLDYGLEPAYYLYRYRDNIEIADVTFEEADEAHFKQLQVLKLQGVKISFEATARLILLSNLKELTLKVLPEDQHHQLYGIKSQDLLRLMGSLRKLEKLSVNMILFPEDDTLKSTQVAALEGIGSLKQMRHLVSSSYFFVSQDKN